MNRDQTFGRLLAIANVLGERVFEKDKIGVAHKHMDRYSKHPRKTLEKIHAELMEYADKFGDEEIHLMDLFGEIMSGLEVSDFSNEPLNPVYLHGYHTQQNALNGIMGTEEAAERWGLSQDHIKRLCRDGKVKCIRIGKTWVLDKNQPSPKQENPSS